MYFEQITMSNDQRMLIQQIISDIKASKTSSAEILFPEELINDEESKKMHITLELYVNPCDFTAMVDLSEKYLGGCVCFTVSLKENKTENRGVAYDI